MTSFPKPRIHRLRSLAATVMVMGLLTGCDGRTDLGATLREFVADFARSALAAFLL